MANKGIKNLRPIKKGELSTKEAQQRGSKGGKATAKNNKERRLMSQIYAELISNGLDKDIEKASKRVMRKGGAPAISLMRELREATEGSKSKTETTLNVNIDDANVADILARHGISKSED